MIPAPLGNAPLEEIMPDIVKHTITHLKYFIVENEKTARRFIKQVCPDKNQSEIVVYQLDKHQKSANLREYISPLLQGTDIGLLSEAGLPAVADPGSLVVAQAHQNNIEVKPLTGPSSLMLALMSSGLNGQKFSFEGYLPKNASELKRKIRHLEQLSAKNNCTKICIETPYRNQKLLHSLLKFLHPDTLLSVACDLTLPTEFIKTLPVKKWQKNLPDLHKRPTVFLFYAR